MKHDIQPGDLIVPGKAYPILPPEESKPTFGLVLEVNEELALSKGYKYLVMWTGGYEETMYYKQDVLERWIEDEWYDIIKVKSK